MRQFTFLVDASLVGGGAKLLVNVEADVQTLVGAVCAKCDVQHTRDIEAEFWNHDFGEWVPASASFASVPVKCKLRLVREAPLMAPIGAGSMNDLTSFAFLVDASKVGGDTGLRVNVEADAQTLVSAVCAKCSVQPTPDMVVEFWDPTFWKWIAAPASFACVPGTCELRLVRVEPVDQEVDEQTDTDTQSLTSIEPEWLEVLAKTNSKLQNDGNPGRFELFRVPHGEGSKSRNGSPYLKVRCLLCRKELQTGGGGFNKPSLHNAAMHAYRKHAIRMVDDDARYV